MYYLLSGAGRFPSLCINKFYHISLLLCTWQQMFSTSPGHITPLSSVGWWKKHFVLYPHNSPCPWSIQNSWVWQRERYFVLVHWNICCVKESPLSLYFENLWGSGLRSGPDPPSIWRVKLFLELVRSQAASFFSHYLSRHILYTGSELSISTPREVSKPCQGD